MDAKLVNNYLHTYSVLAKNGLEVELNNACFSVTRPANPGRYNIANFDTVDELAAFAKALDSIGGNYLNGNKLTHLESIILGIFFGYADNIWCELPDVLADIRDIHSEEEITNTVISLREKFEGDKQ